MPQKSVIVYWCNTAFPGCVMLRGIEKLPCSSPVNFGKHNATSSARIRSHCGTLPLWRYFQRKSTEEPAVSLELLLLKRRNHWFKNGDEWVVLYFQVLLLILSALTCWWCKVLLPGKKWRKAEQNGARDKFMKLLIKKNGDEESSVVSNWNGWWDLPLQITISNWLVGECLLWVFCTGVARKCC